MVNILRIAISNLDSLLKLKIKRNVNFEKKNSRKTKQPLVILAGDQSNWFFAQAC